MSRWIILLRAVTPTGRNKVPMAALRDALQAAGLKQVATLINTGNIVASSRLGQANVERLVHDTVLAHFGGDLAVMARTPAYLRDALQRQPFRDVAPDRLFVAMLSCVPAADAVSALHAVDHSPDRIAVIGDMAYVHCTTEPAKCKLDTAFIERRLQVAATMRVHNTVARLLAMAGD